MFGLFSNQPSPPRDEAWYQAALIRLAKEISELETGVKDKQLSLETSYDDAALSALSGYFEEISARFIRYTRRHQEEYYDILKRSEARKRYASAIVESAKQVAKLFEEYSRRPKSYSRVDSRTKIEFLLADIANLKSFCG